MNIEVSKEAHEEAWSKATSLNDYAARLKTVDGKVGVHYQTARKIAAQYGEEIDRNTFNGHDVIVDDESGQSESELISILEKKGYTLVKEPAAFDPHILHTHDFGGDTFVVGVVSDIHLTSKYQQLSFLHDAYKYFENNGIEIVLNAGDVVAGQKVYRGQAYETFLHGADDQADYFIEHYPKVEGITTYFIGGNHDFSHMSNGGVDVCKRIASNREDMKYLGMYDARMVIDGISFGIMHPDGGGSYARSYKLQKLIEQMSPQNKPQVFIIGHFHTNCELPNYRNVYGLQVGCFESQTPFEIRKGLYPEVGFTVLNIKHDGNDLVSVSKQWFPCFIPRDKDY